jgi:hypothetical protein
MSASRIYSIVIYLRYSLFHSDLFEVQLLDQEKEKEKGNESYTYFIKAKPSQAIHEGPDLEAVGGYFSLPCEVKDGKVKITFLGSAKQVRDLRSMRPSMFSCLTPPSYACRLPFDAAFFLILRLQGFLHHYARQVVNYSRHMDLINLEKDSGSIPSC